MGGAQRAWSILLPGLAARGVEVGLLTLEDEGEFFHAVRRAGVPARCAGMGSRNDLRALVPVLRAAPPADVVVSHDERSHVVARLLARRFHAPHVASDHGGPGFQLKIHRRLALRGLAPGFAAAVTMSERRIPDLVRHGFRRPQIHVIPNGVDSRDLRPARERGEVRAELGLGEQDFVALLSAVLRPEKQPGRYVEAVALAHARDPTVRGLVAGYGPQEPALRALAEGHGDAVRVLGHREDLPDLITAADVLCLTSEVEGAPFAALEAMALERPVAAMRAGALDEVVRHEQTGLLVEPGDTKALADALLRLAADSVLARALGRAGAARQRECFDAGVMCDAHLRLLEELTGGE